MSRIQRNIIITIIICESFCYVNPFFPSPPALSSHISVSCVSTPDFEADRQTVKLYAPKRIRDAEGNIRREILFALKNIYLRELAPIEFTIR